LRLTRTHSASISEIRTAAIIICISTWHSIGKYDPVIRCGFTGVLLAELTPEATPEEAIQACKIYMKNKIDTSLE
jgi:hypothetical protein